MTVGHHRWGVNKQCEDSYVHFTSAAWSVAVRGPHCLGCCGPLRAEGSSCLGLLCAVVHKQHAEDSINTLDFLITTLELFALWCV